MLMEWLEPEIEKRIDELTDKSSETSIDITNKIAQIFNDIKINLPQPFSKATTELGDLFILKIRHEIEFSYRSGLYDGLSLGIDMRNLGEYIPKESAGRSVKKVHFI